MSNPFESPIEAQEVAAGKPYVKSKANLASYAWKLPLCGLGLSMIINLIAKPIGLLGGILFLLGVVVGLILSIVGLVYSLKYARVARHAIGGLILNVLFVLLIVGMFQAVAAARRALQWQSDAEMRRAVEEAERQLPRLSEDNQP